MDMESWAAYIKELAAPAMLEVMKLQTEYMATAREAKDTRQEAQAWDSEDDISWHGEGTSLSSAKDGDEERGQEDDLIGDPGIRGPSVFGDDAGAGNVLPIVNEPHVPGQRDMERSSPQQQTGGISERAATTPMQNRNRIPGGDHGNERVGGRPRRDNQPGGGQAASTADAGAQ